MGETVGTEEPRGGGGGSDEQPSERLNRELIELLNELRVALPGVQVLFAFLLTVPFSDRFETLTSTQRALYFATMVGTTIATALFMAPTSYHRLRFRQGDKERILRDSNVFAIVGIGSMAVSITLAITLVADLLFGVAAAAAVGVAAILLMGGLWFAYPLSRRVREAE
ncbi:MAG TPA: DUF6328 family protein [Actinomycetota bacterium]|nr:DUF6328 family protein [Actinomycetota bacterium]